MNVRLGRLDQADRFRPLFLSSFSVPRAWDFTLQLSSIPGCPYLAAAVGRRLVGGFEKGEQRHIEAATGGASLERP